VDLLIPAHGVFLSFSTSFHTPHLISRLDSLNPRVVINWVYGLLFPRAADVNPAAAATSFGSYPGNGARFRIENYGLASPNISVSRPAHFRLLGLGDPIRNITTLLDHQSVLSGGYTSNSPRHTGAALAALRIYGLVARQLQPHLCRHKG